MKIVFLHVYSEYNTGDAAIISVMIDDFRARYPGVEIKLSSITAPPRKSYKDALYISSFFREAVYVSKLPLQRILRTTAVILGVLFHGILYKTTRISFPLFFSKSLQQFIDSVKEADLIIGVGGGYILGKQSFASTVSLVLTLMEFWFCRQLNKKVFLYSQSIGPFATAFQKKITAYALNQVDQITVREDISRQQLRELNITKPHIKRGYDAAFYFSARTKTRMRNYLMKKGIFFTKPVLGITVRKCFNDERQTLYEQSIATCAWTAVTEMGYKVVFIPHVTAGEQNDDDRDVHTRISSHLKTNRDILFLQDQFSCEEIKGIYDNLDLLIGTRMHSVIFALTGGVPSIAIAYEPKTLGIMKQIGLEKWVLMIEELNAPVLIKSLTILHKSKEEYRSQIKTAVF